MTRAADLLDILEGQVALADHRIAIATDSFERGLWTGRKHATEEAITYIEKALPEIEAEARLVPENETGIEMSVAA